MIFRDYGDFFNTSNQLFTGVPTVNAGSISVI